MTFQTARGSRMPAISSKSTLDELSQLCVPAGPSSLRILLTNLRLLNLDRRNDWPNITATTFSTKESHQNHKRRIQSVEWILYQLFAIWDPDETRNKLQPFFPPLEPLQSLNLRNALFRCLDQVKKEGVLGRDAILRKTMLDECKGERLEDILGTFSTAVLKKVLEQSDHPVILTPAMRLITDAPSNSLDRVTLSSLIIAHKAALRRVVKEKQAARVRYAEFSRLLDSRSNQFENEHAQQEQLHARAEKIEVHPKDTEKLFHNVQQNWGGDHQWFRSITTDPSSRDDMVLSRRIEDIWMHVELGTLHGSKMSEEASLVDQLELKISKQRQRLSKWLQFEQTLPDELEAANLKSKSGQISGIELGFQPHRSLQIGSTPSREVAQLHADLPDDYRKLTISLTKELAAVSQPQAYKQVRSCYARTSTSANSWGNLEDHSSEEFEQPSGLQEEPVLVREYETTLSPTPSPPAIDESTDLATMILKSVSNASPSPTKPRHVLSLVERTRMSMTRLAQFEEPEDLPSQSFSIGEKPETPTELRSDLVERTKMSMSGFAAVQKKAQLEKRRSIRSASRQQRQSSSFSRFDEEIVTERAKSPDAIVEEQDAEYESVFKSRPRVKHSPSMSPTKLWDHEVEAGAHYI